jgi:putative phage-type endonuclease
MEQLRPGKGGELLMASPILLCDTAGMSDDRWQECRRHGPKGNIPYTVGGSDVAAIFGVSPWTTPLELWMIKKGRMKTPAKPNPDQLEMGHLLEPIAAYWYEKKTGNPVSCDTGMYQHASYPYALANFDRRYTRKTDGEPGILECKSCTYHKAEDWADDAIPIYYELQLRFYLAVADVRIGAFSSVWGNNPATDLAMPELVRDHAKEGMIFERLDEWIWSLENDKPPTMADVKPKLALESLARIYGASKPGLPTIEFPKKHEKPLRRIALLQGKITECNNEIKTYEKEIEAHSVRIAELMKEHEYGVLTTTSDKLLIDFVTKTTRRPDSKALKEKYPAAYEDVLKASESRKLKVSVQPI